MERLGRYELLEELGRGAMGVVWKARDPQIDRLVAVKIMTSAEGLSPEEARERRERFQREARAAGRLSHPHIVTIHDVGEDQGRAYLVMELVEGETLEQILRRRHTLPLDEVGRLAGQVAEALDYAHGHGIVHRDVKPANILLTRQGGVKVTDFGIALMAGGTLTQAGVILGTPSYMSPERVAGLKVDGRSDIFSLGAVLYELLSGDRAFPGETISTIVYRILHEEPVPLRRLNPAFPAAVDACLRKALAKEPDRRYTRAAGLARDLCAAAEGRAPAGSVTTVRVPAAPLPRARSTRRPKRTPWAWLGLGASAVAAIGLVLALLLRQPPPPPPPPAAPATVQAPVSPAPDQAEEARRKAEAERLEAERKQLEEEKARLAQEQAALEAARKKAGAETAARPKAEPPPPASREVAPAAPGSFSRFRFSGNTAIASSELEALVRDRLGRPATPEELQAVADQVTQAYLARGYFLARAHAGSEGVKDGVGEIVVEEGRISGLRVGPLLRPEAGVIQAAFAPVLQKGVVERAALAAAIKSLTDQNGLVVRLHIQPTDARGVFLLVVQRSRSGQVEIELPGEGRVRRFPAGGR